MDTMLEIKWLVDIQQTVITIPMAEDLTVAVHVTQIKEDVDLSTNCLDV